MEEIKYRLNHSDATIMANVCERLYETIINKLEKISSDAKNVEELDLLWHEIKTSVKPLTAASCAKLITRITFNSNQLDAKDVLNSFLVSASHAQCPEGICWSVGQILWNLGGKNQNVFGIAKNQHPFVALLRSSPQRNWPFIASQLQIQLEENPAKALELHKSVYVFVFCDPHAHIHFSPLRASLVQGLLNVKNELIDHIVKWLPLEKCSNQVFQEYVSLIVIPWISTCHWEYGMPYLCSLVLQSVIRGLDPRPILNLIKKHGKINNVSVILLAQGLYFMLR